MTLAVEREQRHGAMLVDPPQRRRAGIAHLLDQAELPLLSRRCVAQAALRIVCTEETGVDGAGGKQVVMAFQQQAAFGQIQQDVFPAVSGRRRAVKGRAGGAGCRQIQHTKTTTAYIHDHFIP